MPAKYTRKGTHTKKSTKKNERFFHSNIFRLFIIFLIAAAIPLTVMAVQRIQTVQQEAAEAQVCDGSKLLNANPRPVTRGEEIVFSHTDGPITKNMFEQEDFTGNGVDQKSCTWDSANGWIKCIAKGNDSSSLRDANDNTISNHTWTFRDIKCNYVVVIPKSQDTNKPTNTPKPSPTRPVGGFCNGSVNSGKELGCGANNKPRMRVSWDMRGGTEGKCQALLEQGNSKWILGDKCDSRDGTYIEEDINRRAIDLKPNTSYKLTITNGAASCNKVSTATTADCSTNTATPTSKNPTNTPTQTQPKKISPPEIVKASCQGSTTDPKIKVFGYTTPLATSYIIRLRTSAGGSVIKEQSTTNTEFTISGIEKDTPYYYSVIAVDKDGKKASETKISSDRRITCSFPVQGAPSAMDIISDIWKEITQ